MQPLLNMSMTITVTGAAYDVLEAVLCDAVKAFHCEYDLQSRVYEHEEGAKALHMTKQWRQKQSKACNQ